MKTYVPTFSNGNCVVLYSNDIIRVYSNRPTLNSDVNYTDYYLHNSYMSTTGTQHFSQYSTLPTCIPNTDLTTEYGYRLDFPFILLCSLALIFTGYFFISKLVRTVFVDWRYA